MLLERGLFGLLQQRRLPDLRRFFVLLERVGALDQLKHSFSAYVRRTGEALVADTERDKTLVEEVLEFQERMNEVLSQAFAGTDSFKYAIKEAFTHFVNPSTSSGRPAELLARYSPAPTRVMSIFLWTNENACPNALGSGSWTAS